MPEPLVTIGITAYNAADTIENAIKSALKQTWPHTEIIVVDDASSDTTPTVLSALAEKHPHIKILTHTQNKGVAAARNTIIQQAQGELIAFFDDDDESQPDRLARQYERITAHEDTENIQEAVICYTARLQNYPDGQARLEPAPGSDPHLPAPHGEIMAQRILYGRPVKNGFGSMPTCSQMARTAVYRQMGGFDETFRRSEDTDFNVRFALSGGYFVGIATPFVHQTMTYGSEKTRMEEFKFHQKLLQKHKKFITQHTSFDFCLKWLNTKHLYMQNQTWKFLSQLFLLWLKHPVYTTQRLLWAWPNFTFNRQFKTFLQKNHYD